MTESEIQSKLNSLEQQIVNITNELNGPYPKPSCFDKIKEDYDRCLSINIFRPFYRKNRDCNEKYHKEFEKCSLYYQNYMIALEEKRSKLNNEYYQLKGKL